ncbi:MAG TPA: phosphatidylglycerophosphatase A [Candidatus Binataceae bacterium]|nr:phosphatidylglycerophosphatase A [Candidatus Binataceae bacterium]
MTSRTCAASPEASRDEMQRAPEHLGPVRAAILILATGFGSGFSPFAPGTAGSLVGLVLAWGVTLPLERRSPILAAGAIAALFILGCWVAGEAEKILRQHDSSHIVIDEIVGMAVTMFLNPARFPALIAGFALFRFFDVLKPQPARYIDRHMRGGLGVMLDDLSSAIYANLVLHALVMLVRL